MAFARLENITLDDLYTYNFAQPIDKSPSESPKSPQTSTSSAEEVVPNEPQAQPENPPVSPSQAKRPFSPELEGKIESKLHQEIETYATKVKKIIDSLTANKWLSIALGVIIVLVICLLVVFLPKTPVFHKPDEEIKQLFDEHGSTLHEEILAQIKQGETNVIPICTEDTLFTNDFPKTYELLQKIPFQITYAGIVSLKPSFFQTKQYGYGPNANRTYRYFYTIRESSVYCSGVWIDGEKKMFCNKGLICADVSRESCLFNDCVRRNATVLFFDVIVDRKMGMSLANDISKDDLLQHFI